MLSYRSLLICRHAPLFQISLTMAVTLGQIQQAMSLYGLTIFLILGTIGNLLLIRILLQRTHRGNSCSLYLLSATVVNLILILCILPLAIYSAGHVDPQNVSLIWCKTRSYLFNALLMLYRWYKMAACIDRAVMCSRRAWVRVLSEVRMARRAVLLITVVWLSIPIHLAVYFRIESNRCVPASGMYAKLFSAYSIIISGWSPPIIMVSFGFIAYRNLRKVKKAKNLIPMDHSDSAFQMRRQVMPQNTNNRARDLIGDDAPGRAPNARRLTQRDQQLIVVLMCEVLMYVCTNLLYSINITYSSITSGQDKTTERMRIEAFVAYLSSPFLILINNCFPFYLYCIVSSKFRKDVRHLFSFCGQFPCVSPQRPQPAIAPNRIAVTVDVSWKTPIGGRELPH